MKVTYSLDFLKPSVQALQDAMSEMPQYEPPTEHLFHGGMYCRQVAIPAGCTIVGKKHKKDHFFMVMSGEVYIVDDDKARTVYAPALIQSLAGVKRAIHAITDTVFMTFHATDATTVEQAEEVLVEFDPSSLFILSNKIKDKLCHS
jgi:mannose-6-phosphate isomerase-like protein (cupin superfamily)